MTNPTLAITSVAEPLQADGRILWPINTTDGGSAATIKSRNWKDSMMNYLTLAHYPSTAVMIEYE